MRWWRVFVEKIANTLQPIPPGAPVGPRRRNATRYPYSVQIAAKCTSWPRFVHLFTHDVSEGGLYVPTVQPAEVGESVTIDLTLPEGGSLQLTGTVANVLDRDAAALLKRRPGLGIQLDELTGDNRDKFDLILSAARAEQPKLEIAPFESPPPPAHRNRADNAGDQAVPSAEYRDYPSAEVGPMTVSRTAPAPPDRTIIGIDLGTTNTSVAAVRDGKIVVLTGDSGARSMPSIVGVTRDHQIVAGVAALRGLAGDPAHTVTSPKRLLGRPYTDQQVQTMLEGLPYRTSAGPDGTTAVDMWGQSFDITRLCSGLLAEARELAERALGYRVTRAVLAAPIRYDDGRDQYLVRAAHMAGIEVAAILDEPSAAALANRFAPQFGGIVGVYDFGGGTCDFSIVDVSRGDFRVLATAGDTWLGGDDFDRVLAELTAEQFHREHAAELRQGPSETPRLLTACERAKRILSSQESTAIALSEAHGAPAEMGQVGIRIDRNAFSDAAGELIARSLDVCGKALQLVSMAPDELDAVYLSGGTTYIPAVRQALDTYFGVPICLGAPPEYAVCLGAAVHATQLQRGRARAGDELAANER